MHSRSPGPSLMSSVTKKPLLRMLRCDRVAPLGEPVVPEVYWMLIGSPGCRPCHPGAQGGRGHLVGAMPQAFPIGGAQEDDLGHIGSLGTHLADHAAVVGGLERRRRHQQPRAGLTQHIGQFVGAVGGIDRHQDRADLGRRVLQNRPFRAVGRPDADTIPALDIAGHQSTCHAVDLDVQLGVGPAPAAGTSTSASVSGYVDAVRSKFAPIVSSRRGVSVGPAA